MIRDALWIPKSAYMRAYNHKTKSGCRIKLFYASDLMIKNTALFMQQDQETLDAEFGKGVVTVRMIEKHSYYTNSKICSLCFYVKTV